MKRNFMFVVATVRELDKSRRNSRENNELTTDLMYIINYQLSTINYQLHRVDIHHDVDIFQGFIRQNIGDFVLDE